METRAQKLARVPRTARYDAKDRVYYETCRGYRNRYATAQIAAQHNYIIIGEVWTPKHSHSSLTALAPVGPGRVIVRGVCKSQHSLPASKSCNGRSRPTRRRSHPSSTGTRR